MQIYFLIYIYKYNDINILPSIKNVWNPVIFSNNISQIYTFIIKITYNFKYLFNIIYFYLLLLNFLVYYFYI
jgi:hypothetical protein